MAIDFQGQRFVFSRHSGSQNFKDQNFTFPSTVSRATATLAGFGIGYSNADHELLRQEIFPAVTVLNRNVVTVRVFFSLRDASGTFDDPFEGFADILVVAERA